MMFSVKRTREEVEAAAVYSTSRPAGRSFTCKTCNREFPSFQALGGHRASHKKPNKLIGVDGLLLKPAPSSPPKPKRHECPICGLEFAIGQALGGHMRRHRAPNTDTNTNVNVLERKINDDQLNAKKLVTMMTNSTCSTTTTTTSSTVSEAGDQPRPDQRVVKKPRVVIFGVDLSLVEQEKDVNLELGLAGRDSPALLDLFCRV